jgi:hypothetical protein
MKNNQTFRKTYEVLKKYTKKYSKKNLKSFEDLDNMAVMFSFVSNQTGKSCDGDENKQHTYLPRFNRVCS